MARLGPHRSQKPDHSRTVSLWRVVWLCLGLGQPTSWVTPALQWLAYICMHAHIHTHTQPWAGQKPPAFKEQALEKNLRWLEFLSSELRRGKAGEPPTEGMAGKG